MTMCTEIKETIEEAIPGSTAHIFDPRNDQKHLAAIVISKEFIGVNRVKRHQMVMQPLSGHFDTFLHALSLKTMTPEEWERDKDRLLDELS